jgi:C-terminal processing protease CtpA/Prc
MLILGAQSRAAETGARTNTLPAGLVNPDFEQGELGKVPTGWFVPIPSRAAGFTAELTEEGARTGKRCVVLARTKPAEDGAPPGMFGNIMQAFDATSFRGKRVRLRAAVRVESEGAGAHAQLWLRVDRPGGKMGFFDNMGDRPITASSWTTYEIAGAVEEDAESINLGLMLIGSGNGKAWLDSAEFETLGQAVTHWEKPRPLSDRGLENLIAFTRLLGYVRHFHPSDAAAATDWNSVAVLGVKAVEDVPDAPALARNLENVFRPIAPTVRVFVTGKSPGVPSELAPPADSATLEVVAWRHRGFGGGKAPMGQNIYSSQRVREPAPKGEVPSGLPNPREPFQAELGAGVSCLVPLGLYADDKGTLPHQPAAKSQKVEAWDFSGNDRATRLADVALAWNVFQHFYPYFDVVGTDWPQALRQALQTAATDADERAFLDTLRRLVATLHDGHGNVGHKSDSDFAAPPLKLAWVEGHLVVTWCAEQGADKLKPGDVLLKIDGKPVQELLAEKEQLISAATPQWFHARVGAELLRGAPGSSVTLELQAAAEPSYSVTLKREATGMAREKRPEKIHEIKSGIWYVDLDASQAKVADFQQALPNLEKAKGIIFDLRGYPNEVAMKVLPLLADKPITSAKWCVPIVTWPDRQKWDFATSSWAPFGPDSPRLKAKVAFLTDGGAISYAESIMGIVEYYKLGEIVGEPTAGTNGNVNPLELPGGYSIAWTGMKVLKHDGSRHHGVGIRPTVPVSRTVRGVAEGRDEVLQKAIEVVQRSE